MRFRKIAPTVQWSKLLPRRMPQFTVRYCRIHVPFVAKKIDRFYFGTVHWIGTHSLALSCCGFFLLLRNRFSRVIAIAIVGCCFVYAKLVAPKRSRPMVVGWERGSYVNCFKTIESCVARSENRFRGWKTISQNWVLPNGIEMNHFFF